MSELRSLCYALARLLGDLLALRSPGRIAKRAKNKLIGRQAWRLWR